MKILKRSGVEVAFDVNKIIAAVTKANQTVDKKNTLPPNKSSQSGNMSREFARHSTGRFPSRRFKTS